MAFGAVGESLRRVTGGGVPGGSVVMSEANMERLVAKLSRMRGAALKLGQMMSFQGKTVVGEHTLTPTNTVYREAASSSYQCRTPTRARQCRLYACVTAERSTFCQSW